MRRCPIAIILATSSGLLMLGAILAATSHATAGTAFIMVGGLISVGLAVALRRESQRLTATLKSKSKAIGTSASLFSTLAEAVESDHRLAQDAVEAAELQAKELQIQLKVIDAERAHAESIIYSISDAVLVTDSFDELIFANESAARAFAFDLAAANRSPLGNVLSDKAVVEMIRDMRQRNGRSGRRIVEHEVATPEGTKAYKITLSSVGAGHDAEAPGGVVAVMHDVTHEREVAQMKNDFVSSVSHELRTPLASIKAYVELLIDGEANDQKTQREFYDVIQNEANRLGRLIDNILSISRIESGLMKVTKQPQSLSVIAKEAIEVITPQAGGKGITVSDDLAPVFYQASGDRDMLYQAMLNLLSNAVKYTPDGGTITVETAVDETRKKFTAKVIDNGVGIPPKDLPFVFDKFYRSEANSRMAKGTGLGLSLVKHIVETVHGGRCFVESEVGKGSCFGFEMDLCE